MGIIDKDVFYKRVLKFHCAIRMYTIKNNTIHQNHSRRIIGKYKNKTKTQTLGYYLNNIHSTRGRNNGVD